jgi:hypothetical protein
MSTHLATPAVLVSEIRKQRRKIDDYQEIVDRERVRLEELEQLARLIDELRLELEQRDESFSRFWQTCQK